MAKDRVAFALLSLACAGGVAWSVGSWLATGGIEHTTSNVFGRLARHHPVTVGFAFLLAWMLTDAALPEASRCRKLVVAFAWLGLGHVFWGG